VSINRCFIPPCNANALDILCIKRLFIYLLTYLCHVKRGEGFCLVFRGKLIGEIEPGMLGGELDATAFTLHLLCVRSHHCVTVYIRFLTAHVITTALPPAVFTGKNRIPVQRHDTTSAISP